MLNPKRKQTLPFDIDDQIYVEHTDKSTLVKGLDNKLPLIIKKVQLLTGYESDQGELVRKKYNALDPEAKELLKRLVLEGPIELEVGDFEKLISNDLQLNTSHQNELRRERFIVDKVIYMGAKRIQYRRLNEIFWKHLIEILWE